MAGGTRHPPPSGTPGNGEAQGPAYATPCPAEVTRAWGGRSLYSHLYSVQQGHLLGNRKT